MLEGVILRRVALLSALILAACGGGDIPASLASPTPAPTASPTPSAAPTAAPTATEAPTTAAGGITFTVASGSKAIVRINEQLADRTLPNDAVLTSEKVSGEFTLLPDGTFAPTSKIAVDLDGLESDNDLRDNTVKRSVLETRRFPQAVFVPTKAEGLKQPLSVSTEQSFKLVGQMTIRGVTKELAFDVKATPAASELRASAQVAPAFQFATFGMTQPRVFSVISIKDEIRLDVELVAKQK